MLVTMKEILERASEGNYAVAAPNVDHEMTARAAIEAAENMNAPLILDVSYDLTADIVLEGKLLRELCEQTRIPVAINLDHGASKFQVVRAINAGFTSVMIDRSSYPYEVNVADTKEIVDIAHQIDVSVEAELGHVGMANNYDEDRNAALTEPEMARRFVEETGVDCLAVAIGTAHGAYPRGFKPYLDFERLTEIKKAVNGLPLVLHGSSGTDIEDLRKVCAMGINKVNISNDLCKAAATAAQEADFSGNKAYSIWQTLRNAFRDKLEEMIVVYGSKDKAWTKEKGDIPRYKPM